MMKPRGPKLVIVWNREGVKVQSALRSIWKSPSAEAKMNMLEGIVPMLMYG